MPFDVVQVIPNDDYSVYVYFADGIIKKYDAKPLLEKGVFSVLKDLQFFKEKCTVINNTLAWDRGGNYNEYECLDIDPQSIYETGITVEDPLVHTA